MVDLVINLENTKFHLRVDNYHKNIITDQADEFHMHFFAEFHYILDGIEQIKTIDKTYEVNKGELCIIPPLLHHSPIYSNMQRIAFNITVSKIKDEGASVKDYFTRISDYLSSIKEILIFKDSTITSLMTEYNALSKSSDNEIVKCRCTLLLINLFLYLISKSNRTNQDKSKDMSSDTTEERRYLIEDYISTCYMKSNGLSELARLLNVCERRTSELVKQIMGSDFKTLITNQRMITASLLIDQGELTLEEISRLVGYNSYSGFYSAFKKYKKQQI